jgi:hypothetical protein
MWIGAMAPAPNSTTSVFVRACHVPTRGVISAAVAGSLEAGSQVVLLVDSDEEATPAIVGDGYFAFLFAVQPRRRLSLLGSYG